MNKIRFVDLKPHFNFRYVYPDDTAIVPGEFIGINNLIIREKDYGFGVNTSGGASALFDRNPDGGHLVSCGKQAVKAGFVCDKARIFGFAAWGVYKEVFRFVFDGGETDCRIGFSDLSKHVGDETFTLFDADEADSRRFAGKFITHNAYHGFIDKDITVNTYMETVSFGKRKLLKEILLPDNFFVYIAAITLENMGK
jgi:hypothetical protein